VTRTRLRRGFFYAARAIGIFALARHLTSRWVRILCYHGASIGDQHEFLPGLFMRPETFERRLRTLAAGKWRIVELDTALADMANNRVSGAPVAITIDDGWKSTIDHMVPALKRAKMPSMLYVTTHYVQHRGEVFNVACQYMLWRSRRESFELKLGIEGIDGTYKLNGDLAAIRRHFVKVGNQVLNEAGRQQLLRQLALALGLDFDEVMREGRFRLMEAGEVAPLSAQGVDVQLHTHRHRTPVSSQEDMAREIIENRQFLEPLKGAPCEHFCYPSGEYDPRHPAWLAACGVRSATTTESGLCDATSNRFLLPRILDRDDWTDIEFEAALSGLHVILARLRSKGTVERGLLGLLGPS